MKNKKRLALLTGLLLISSMTGCTQKAETKEADAGSSLDNAGHASVSTVTLTEGKYSEDKLDDTWEEDNAVYLSLEGDRISAEVGRDTESGDSVSEENASAAGGGMDYIEIEGSRVTITGEGTYILSGTLEDGQIIVDAKKEETVRLVLDGVSVTCGTSSPFYSKGGNVIVILAEGTENTFADAEDYQYENEGDDEPDAAVFSKDDLTFNGTGILNVTGNYNHAVHCKDDLKFVTGTYVVSAADDGIVGKDSISVKNGNFTIESGDDGMKASNAKESDKGYILIEKGSFEITSGGDGIQAETLLRINDGNIDITADGGSGNARKTSEISEIPGDRGTGMPPENMPEDGDMREEMTPPEGDMREQMTPPEGDMREQMTPPEGDMREKMTPPEGDMREGMTPPEEDMREQMTPPEGEPGEGMAPPEGESEEQMTPSEEGTIPADGDESDSGSSKALKSYVDLIIAGGEYSLDSCDDAIHSDQNITIEAGTFSVSTGDDGVHAGQKLTVNGGVLDISQSYEGIEGFEITVNGGDIRIIASDDGINAAASKDESAEDEQKSMDVKKGFPEEDQGAVMTFNGGNVYVDADGDGLDANGDIFINGGTLTVHGPVSGGNATLDFASVCKVTGGAFTGTGSIGMAQNPSDDSTQPVLVWNMSEPMEAGTVLSVYNGRGESIAEITAEKTAQWFAVSSPELKTGETYTICTGDIRKQVKLETAVTQIRVED